MLWLCCEQRPCPLWCSAPPGRVNCCYGHNTNGDFFLTPPGGHHHQKPVKRKSCRQRKVQGRTNKSTALFIYSENKVWI